MKKTEKNWNAAGYKVKDAQRDKGETVRWKQYKLTYVLYDETQVKKMTEKQLQAYKRKAAKERRAAYKARMEKKRAEEALRKQEEEKEKQQALETLQMLWQDTAACLLLGGGTAWQWLYWHKRVIVPAARHFVKPDNKFHYYRYGDTRQVRSEEEYERLKQQYIEQFGGWETIDLDSTKYIGDPWYQR